MNCAIMKQNTKKEKELYTEHFKEKIKLARKNAGYTQQQVEDNTGIPRSTICRIETGQREPTIENLAILIDFYEVSADWILGTGIKKGKE